MNTPRFPDVTAQILGRDGNVFVIIGAVIRALHAAGHHEAADSFAAEAVRQKSYDAVLALVRRTVHVR